MFAGAEQMATLSRGRCSIVSIGEGWIDASAELLRMPRCVSTLAHVTRLSVAQAFLRRPVIVLLIFFVFRQLQPQHDERESILLRVNLLVQGWRATPTLYV
jgi:hypothetical protein